MGFCEQMGKTLMFVFNAIFFLCGAAMLAIGIWIVADKGTLVSLVAKAGASDVSNQLDANSVIEDAAYVLIAVGVLAFLIGFCGCCGACKDSLCLLRLYAFFVGLLLILQIAGVILAAIFRNKIESKLVDGLIKLQNSSYVGLPLNSKENSVSLAFDIVMITMKCCGVNGTTDFRRDHKTNAHLWYTTARNQTEPALKIPFSCCKMKSTDFLKDGKYGQITDSRKNKECGPKMKAYYLKGCYDRIKSKIVKYALVIIAVALVIILIEIIGIVITCCLISKMNDKF